MIRDNDDFNTERRILVGASPNVVAEVTSDLLRRAPPLNYLAALGRGVAMRQPDAVHAMLRAAEDAPHTVPALVLVSGIARSAIKLPASPAPAYDATSAGQFIA
ncbi:hypothetical protein GGI21_002681, partial [Coemansia aciculifera]